MPIVACTMSSCKYQERENGIPKSRCTKEVLRLVAHPLYLELAKKFSGTVRCLEYEKYEEE
jgi:hypothetical protein